MSGIRVLTPGLLTTVQDLGRWGHQQEGMVVAGAMDPFSMQLANLLVGNPRNEACLEITLFGPKLEFLTATVIAITGGDLLPRINGTPVEGWRALEVKTGDVLEFGSAVNGCRAYLAVAGGFALTPVMGSYATYLRGQLGGFKGRALLGQDVVPLRRSGVKKSEVSPPWFFAQPLYGQSRKIRVVSGPQAEHFTQAGRETFYSSEYEVTPSSDRMGYRLRGPEIEHLEGSDIISDGIPFGGIQVPADGLPIILMADRQTTGGYTKIGTVASVDLPLIAQSKPGDRLRFVEVSVDEAQELYLERERVLESLEAAILRRNHEILKKTRFNLLLQHKNHEVK